MPLMADTPDIFPQEEEDDIFDEFDPDDDVGLVDTDSSVQPIPYGFTWTYDFNKEDLDFSAGNPAKAYDLGVVNEWITHTTNIERFETPIYSEDIGTDIFSLVGNLLDAYVISRTNQELIKAISVHDRIDEVTNIYSFALKGNIYTFFTYTTDDTIDGQALIKVN
jgi:hypothetical protein